MRCSRKDGHSWVLGSQTVLVDQVRVLGGGPCCAGTSSIYQLLRVNIVNAARTTVDPFETRYLPTLIRHSGAKTASGIYVFDHRHIGRPEFNYIDLDTSEIDGVSAAAGLYVFR
ncbi:MAG: hypothetical protein U5K75_00200 [Ahrensia sp.]|nr:hypothetical protein [Ahrensia sp.]